MNDERSLKDNTSSSIIDLDENEYSVSNYPEQYQTHSKSSYTESTQGLKSIRINKRQKSPQEVVVRISAKSISRKDRVRQINEAIKRGSAAY